MTRVMVYMVFFTIYTFILLFWGKSGFKKTNTIEDFCVADNSFTSFISTATYTVTLFSAVSMQSVTGSVYQYGYSAILYSVVGWLFGSSILILLIKKIKQANIVTISEYMKKRYSSTILQNLSGIVLVICYIFYVIIQIKGFGIVVSELLDIDYRIAAALIYMFIVYTGFGGLFSVAKTDILNFILIVTGIGVVAISVLYNVGGFETLHNGVKEFSDGALLSSTSNGRFSPVMIATTAMAWGLGTAANPQYIIRIVSAKTEQVAVRMICSSNIVLSFIYLGLIIIGLGIRIQLGPLETINVDEVLSYFVGRSIHPIIGGLMFISIIAAAVSTANSQLLLLSSSFTYDVYNNISKKKLTDDKFLSFNRVIILVAGTISLILSMQPLNTLLIYGSYVWSVVSAVFLWPLYGGIYWKKANEKGALASAVVGVLTVLIFFTIPNSTPILGQIHPVLPSTVISFFVFYLVSKYTRDPGAQDE